MKKKFKVGDYVSIISWQPTESMNVPSPKIGKIIKITELNNLIDNNFLIEFFTKIRKELQDYVKDYERRLGVDKNRDLAFCAWTEEKNLRSLNFKETIWLVNKLEEIKEKSNV